MWLIDVFCFSLKKQARHIYICDYHKQVIQCARTKQQQQRRRKDSEDDSGETDNDLPEVDLYQLQVGTLRRYKRHYKLPTKPTITKALLADVSLNEPFLVLKNNACFACSVLMTFSNSSTAPHEALQDHTDCGKGHSQRFPLHGENQRQQIGSEERFEQRHDVASRIPSVQCHRECHTLLVRDLKKNLYLAFYMLIRVGIL